MLSRKRKKRETAAKATVTNRVKDTAKNGIIRSMASQHGGKTYSVGKDPVMIGRDASSCSVVYKEGTPGVSCGGSNGIFIVADGLGGHSMGELASSCAVNVITAGWQGFDDDPQEQLKSLFGPANAAILALQKEKRTVMKSTAAVLAIENNKAVWANSGDSRVYYFHKSRLASCTQDHSVAYKKYKAGEITRDMLGSDEDQSSLLRTLGNEERFVPDTYEAKNAIEVGDAFMLCSASL